MNCCLSPATREAGEDTPQRWSAACEGTDRFFGRAAKRYRKRFRKKGLEKSQEQLMALIEKSGINDRTIIEVGCGVGFFHRELLRRGGDRALGIDLSERMLEEAREMAEDESLAERTDYQQGDFVVLDIACSDVVVLDKVICCYPDRERLVRAAAERASAMVAFTIPRWRWITRLTFGFMSVAEWIFKFRGFVHHPRDVDEQLVESGLELAGEARTFFWLSRAYVRTTA